MTLENKTALVTGGGSGIGLAIAKGLIAKGTKVIISGRNKAKLEKAKEKHTELSFEVCDITKVEQIKNLVNALETKHGGIDLLINNAGMFEKVDYTNGIGSFDASLAEDEGAVHEHCPDRSLGDTDSLHVGQR